jgi:hypothetical protein
MYRPTTNLPRTQSAHALVYVLGLFCTVLGLFCTVLGLFCTGERYGCTLTKLPLPPPPPLPPSLSLNALNLKP